MKIQAYYQHGIDSAKDQAAFTIAKKYNANLIGSGCCLFGTFERDLEWIIEEDRVPMMSKDLRLAGFRVTSCPA